MRIIKNNIIPFDGYKCINICGILFTRSSELDETTIIHEKIHTAQMLEMFIIVFYLWYIVEYIIIAIRRRGDKQGTKYHDISFEEEAYNNEHDAGYLEKRKHYAWTKYLRIGSYEEKK